MKFREWFKKRKKIVIIVLVLIIIAVVAFVMYSRNKAKKAMENMDTDLSLESVERQTISNYVAMTGTVVANDSQTVYSTQNGLKVLSVNVEVGDEVKKGDVIAVLDSTDAQESLETEQRRLEVEEAKKNLGLVQAAENLQDAKVDGLDNWKEGEISVSQANTDYSYAQIEYQRACEDLSKAKNDLAHAIAQKEEDLEDARDAEKDAKKDYENAKKDGSDEDAISTLKKAYEAAKDKRKDLEDELSDEEKKYTFSSYYNSISSAERSVQNAQESLEKSERSVQSANEKFADSAEDARRKIVDQQEALQSQQLDASIATDSTEDKVKELQKQVDECTITAPMSGVITSVSMEEGDETSNDNNTICVIQDTSGFKAEGTVDEYDISKLYDGMSAIIKTEATGDLEMTGTVSFVSPTPKASNSSSSAASTSSSSAATYPVRVTIDALDDAVRIGMTAEVEIILETAEDVLTVPYDCIIEKDDGTYAIRVADGAMGENGDEKSDKTSGMPGGKGGKPDMTAVKGREITVEKGLETDYYVEISGKDVKEGMQVYVNSDDGSGGSEFSIGIGGGPMGGGPM